MININDVFVSAVKLYDIQEDPTPKLISNITRAYLSLDQEDQAFHYDTIVRASEDCKAKIELGDEDYLAPLIRIATIDFTHINLGEETLSNLTDEQLKNMANLESSRQ